MDAKKTGELIATLRHERNLNQSELADLIGVSNKAISRWETGRGYPDIETLPKISEVLNISIPELLSGQRDQQVADDADPQPLFETSGQGDSDHSIETVCQYAGEQARKQKKKFIMLGILLSVVVFIFSLISFAFRILPGILDLYVSAEEFYWSVGNFYWSIVGSEDCVIADDYTSLTYLGETYLPLPMNGYEAVCGEEMVEECQVQGAGFLGKLFFGETLYEIKNVTDQELVYLQTDYDECISEYFVLETEYDRYAQMVQDADVRYYYAVYENESLYRWDCRLGEDLSVWLQAPDSDSISSKPDHTDIAEIHVFDQNHIFYEHAGWIYRTEEGYYWAPEKLSSYDYEQFGSQSEIYFPVRIDQYYPINGFDHELSKLFLN